MHRFALLALATFAGSLAARAQEVKYEKYTLPNGMKVILHEDHSLPIATINTWYSVGAQDEPPGRSGFAHLFEHLMFMGTKRVPDNQFDVIMETGGGANNASTDLHRTDYYSFGPAKLLPTLLWLDAERLESMGLCMTKDKLDKQRDVVRNELRQSVENAPYGKADEMLWPLLFPPGHPYRTGVIGTHEDLEAANVNNVKDFFANFYVPNNACLVVAGDFNSAEIKPLIASLFGTLPKGADIPRKYSKPTEPIPVKLEGVKRFTAIDKVELPRVQFNYMSPVAFAQGDAETRLAASVLADGKSSRLYKRLVIDEKLADEVSAAQQAFPLASSLQINILAKPEADLDKVEKIADEELARFVKEGPTDAELERTKATIELTVLQQLQSIDRKAVAMNEYEYYLGDPNGFKRDLDRFRTATPAAVRAWAERVITPNARVISRVLPEDPQLAPSARDARPTDAKPSSFTPPLPQSFALKNGLKVVLLPKHDLPLVSLAVLVKPQGPLDSPAKQGLANLTAQMLDEGAGDLDALAFENAVQALGGTFGSSAGEETAGLSMTILKRNFDKGVALFADALRRPRFDAKEWDRVKGLHLNAIRQAEQVPGRTAGRVASRLLFGDNNPYGWSTDGTIETVEPLSLADVKAAHALTYRPEHCTLILAGDLDAAETKATLDKVLGDWTVANVPKEPATPDFSIPKASGLRFAIVDRPGATQTFVRFEAPGFKYNNPDRVGLHLLNTILGGSFTSRLNQNLREAHGYTYGARSSFDMHLSAGAFSAGASVQVQSTGAALAEFMKEFDRVIKQGDITDAEATKAKETLRNETVRSFQGLGGLVGVASILTANGLPFSTIADELSAIERLSAKDLNALAKRSIQLDQGVLVLVGDKKAILEQIKDLKLAEPLDLDAEGQPAKAK